MIMESYGILIWLEIEWIDVDIALVVHVEHSKNPTKNHDLWIFMDVCILCVYIYYINSILQSLG